MTWLEIRIETSDEGIEPVYAALDALGISAVSVEESCDRMEKQLCDGGILWDYADIANKRTNPCVVGYAPADAGDKLVIDIRAALNKLPALCPHMELGSLELTLTAVDESAWENNWKQYYKPFPVGNRLLVRPDWEPYSQTDRTEIVIDPSMAFGTGSHETTRMCLELLDACLRDGDAVLDLGCGSGILAIAAKKLGAARVLAVDIDPVAQKVARENAARNGLTDLPVYVGNPIADADLRQKIGGRYDCIVSNIVADVIVALAPFAFENIAEKGIWISSGIIADRENDVRRAFAAYDFAVLDVKADGEWRAFLCQRG